MSTTPTPATPPDEKKGAAASKKAAVPAVVAPVTATAQVADPTNPPDEEVSNESSMPKQSEGSPWKTATIVACVAALLFLCTAFFAFYQGVGADARLRVAEEKITNLHTLNTTAAGATSAALAKLALAEDAAKTAQSKLDEQVAENSRLKGEQSGLTKTYADLKTLCERKAPVVVTAPHANSPQGHDRVVSIPAVPVASVGSSSDTAAYWYWRENTATVEKPGRCIFSGGDGTGKPPFCASFTISVPNKDEGKSQWIGRVGNGRVALDQAIWQKKD